MARGALTRVTVVVGALGILALTVSAWLYWEKEHELDRSLDVLVERLWAVRSSTERRVTSWSLFESEGVWLVRWKGSAATSQTRFLVDGMSVADASDHEYYRREVTNVLSLGFSLGSYMLYRGEFPLGNGTICPVLACNIEILVKEGDPLMIVRISTT